MPTCACVCEEDAKREKAWRVDVTARQHVFNDAGAAFHLLATSFHKGGRANRSQASFSLTLFEELAAGRPMARYSLLLHARSKVHAQTHNYKPLLRSGSTCDARKESSF